jgi:hypothetical protein
MRCESRSVAEAPGRPKGGAGETEAEPQSRTRGTTQSLGVVDTIDRRKRGPVWERDGWSQALSRVTREDGVDDSSVCVPLAGRAARVVMRTMGRSRRCSAPTNSREATPRGRRRRRHRRRCSSLAPVGTRRGALSSRQPLKPCTLTRTSALGVAQASPILTRRHRARLSTNENRAESSSPRANHHKLASRAASSKVSAFQGLSLTPASRRVPLAPPR